MGMDEETRRSKLWHTVTCNRIIEHPSNSWKISATISRTTHEGQYRIKCLEDAKITNLVEHCQLPRLGVNVSTNMVVGNPYGRASGRSMHGRAS